MDITKGDSVKEVSDCYAVPIIGVTVTVAVLILFRKWMQGGTCKSKAKLHGQTVIITGGNTGIGKETAEDLAFRGARVIVACRDMEKGERAAKEINQKIGKSSVLFKKLDLASLQSVREFAEDILKSEPHINILINNAGVMACPPLKTKDGFEMQFGVNHLGHFLLTHLLLDRIKASAPARIVNVSSLAHKFGRIHFSDINLEKKYSPYAAYGQSKLANILFTRELSRHLAGSRVTVYSLHPGSVKTELGRHFISNNLILGWLFTFCSSLFFKTSKQGAQTSIYCAVSEDLQNETGYYYSDCRRTEPASFAKDDNVAKKLWELSETMVKLKN